MGYQCNHYMLNKLGAKYFESSVDLRVTLIEAKRAKLENIEQKKYAC